MKALILAAGEGTRLRPLTLDRPKPMLPVGGKPLLEHLVTWLRRHAITDIAINLHYKPEAITDYFGDGRRFGVSITYSFEEQPLGTAGAARKLQPFLDETFVVVYGDVFTNLDLTRLVWLHNARKVAKGPGEPEGPAASPPAPPGSSGSSDPCLSLALYHVDNPTECGLVELDDNDRAVRFVEKPPPGQVFTDLANAGVLVVEPGILDHIPPDTFYDFGHDLFPQLMNQGVPLYGHVLQDDEFLIDIGTPAALRRAQDVAYRRCVETRFLRENGFLETEERF